MVQTTLSFKDAQKLVSDCLALQVAYKEAQATVKAYEAKTAALKAFIVDTGVQVPGCSVSVHERAYVDQSRIPEAILKAATDKRPVARIDIHGHFKPL